MPCALASIAWGVPLVAQPRGAAPVAPAATIGPVTDAPTLSVLGLAGRAGDALVQRNDVWIGATQPVGQLGRVRVTAIANGDWKVRDAVGAEAAAEGMVALRARARVGQQRVWTAVSYGRSSFTGRGLGGLLPEEPLALGGVDLRGADTTVSRRVDLGSTGRAEAGVIRAFGAVEFSVGFSVERTSRVTSQTLTIDEPGFPVPVGGSSRLVSTTTTRSLQRRDLATGMASLGFQTGPTMWLVSVTSPVASWVTSDALAPMPGVIPTVASLAVVQPITQWLSVVGAAASNPATVGGTALRDAAQSAERRAFSPVVALGIRIDRLPFRGSGDGTPGGILAFESRTLGAVDSLSVEQGMSTSDSDTLRVVLLVDAPRAETVELMGDATAWTVTPMRRVLGGKWRVELKLAPGAHRVIVRADGGRWIAPPGVPIGNDDYGTPVGVIVVKGTR